jgi:cold shock CspA family protein
MKTKYGIITRIVLKGKYGFIRKDEGGDLFFHINGVCSHSFEELREGFRVQFLEVEGPKGNRAIGVVVI